MIRLFENDIFNYLGLVIVGSGFLWCVLRVALHGVRHDIARGVLLASVVIAMVAPLVTVAVYPTPPPLPSPQIVLADEVEYVVMETAQEIPTDYTFILYIIYGVVAAGFLWRLGRNIRGIRRIGRPVGHVVLSESVERPFSFLNTIYINSADAKDAMIMSHERAHVRLLHSWDRLFMETVTAIFWVNPFFYLLHRDLREVHEFQADQAVTRSGYDREIYKTLIFSRMLGTNPDIAEGLAYILTKKRITMISQTHTRGWKRTLLLLPAVAALVATVTFTTKPAAAQSPTLTPAITTAYNDVSLDNVKILVNGKPYTGKIEDLDPDNIKLISIDNNQIVISTKDTVNVTIRQRAKLNGKPFTVVMNGEKIGSSFNFGQLNSGSVNSVGVDMKNHTFTITTKDYNDPAPVTQAETMPKFQGQDGKSAFPKWLKPRLKDSGGKNLNGTLQISFVIDKSGKLTDAKVVTGVDKEVDQQMLDLINSAPAEWTPAMNDGKPVSCMIMMILFRFMSK